MDQTKKEKHTLVFQSTKSFSHCHAYLCMHFLLFKISVPREIVFVNVHHEDAYFIFAEWVMSERYQCDTHRSNRCHAKY